MQNEKIVYVYFNKDNSDILMGKLYIDNLRGKEVYSFSKQGSTFLVKRFDREKRKRIHFESAMTLLGKNDGDDNVSYLKMVNGFYHQYMM